MDLRQRKVAAREPVNQVKVQSLSAGLNGNGKADTASDRRLLFMLIAIYSALVSCWSA